MKLLRIIILIIFSEVCFSKIMEEKGEITYISSNMIYFNLGTKNHLAVKDTIQVVRNDKIVEKILVSHLSFEAGAGIAISGGNQVKLHDVVLFRRIQSGTNEQISITTDKAEQYGILKETKTRDRLPDVSADKNRVMRIVKKVNGRIYSRYSGFYDSGQGRFIDNEPSLYLRLNGNTLLFDNQMEYGTFIKIKKNFSSAGNYPDKNLLRIYSAWTKIPLPFYRSVKLGVGRLYSGYLRGIGITDGILLEKNFSGRLSVGTQIGFQPDVANTSLDPNSLKGGMFVNWRGISKPLWKCYFSSAAIGQYKNGKIDREFLYSQGNIAIAKILKWNVSTEIDLNRSGNRRVRPLVQVSSLNSALQLKPINSILFTFRSGFTKSVKLLESQKDFPDSLFTNEYRYFLLSDMKFRFSPRASLLIGGVYRTSRNSIKSMYGLFSYFRFFNTGMFSSLSLGYRYTANLYVTGHSLHVSVDKDIIKGGGMGVYAETYIYKYGDFGDYTLRERLQLRFYQSLWKNVFISGYLELQTDSFSTTEELFIETGYKF